MRSCSRGDQLDQMSLLSDGTVRSQVNECWCVPTRMSGLLRLMPDAASECDLQDLEVAPHAQPARGCRRAGPPFTISGKSARRAAADPNSSSIAMAARRLSAAMWVMMSRRSCSAPPVRRAFTSWPRRPCAAAPCVVRRNRPRHHCAIAPGLPPFPCVPPHFGAHECLMLPRLALTIHEVTHQVSHDLGRRPVQGLRLCHELIAQLGLELHREDGFLAHVCSEVLTKFIQQHYRPTSPRSFTNASPAITASFSASCASQQRQRRALS